MREPKQLLRVGGGELTIRWRWLEGLGFTRDSSAVYGDGTIGLWSFDEARLLVRWRAHEAEVSALAVGVDGLLASGSEDTTIAIWELPMRGTTG
ncbi:MAG: hypothetical protein H6719_08235 [Sandaracinaceae bacterium]|nr:hypothetical protein [Sandaracinaceae bacterium]